MLDQLELQSGYARRWLLDSPMMTKGEEIVAAYDTLRRFTDFVDKVEKTYVDTLRFRLQGLKDIRTTIRNLSQKVVLDDIELFEVKHLALLATDLNKLLGQHGMDRVVEIPALDEVISILDPDGMKIATFYIYDSYCAQLKDLRNQMRQHPELQDELLLQAGELEEGVRQDLSRQLHPFAAAIAARPIPVLPLVGSMITEPSFSKPFSSASSIIAFAIRSLTEPAGLKYSSFTRTVACNPSSFSIFTTSTRGVFPISPKVPL